MPRGLILQPDPTQTERPLQDAKTFSKRPEKSSELYCPARPLVSLQPPPSSPLRRVNATAAHAHGGHSTVAVWATQTAGRHPSDTRAFRTAAVVRAVFWSLAPGECWVGRAERLHGGWWGCGTRLRRCVPVPSISPVSSAAGWDFGTAQAAERIVPPSPLRPPRFSLRGRFLLRQPS